MDKPSQPGTQTQSWVVPARERRCMLPAAVVHVRRACILGSGSFPLQSVRSCSSVGPLLLESYVPRVARELGSHGLACRRPLATKGCDCRVSRHAT